MNWKPIAIVGLGILTVVLGLRPWSATEDFTSQEHSLSPELGSRTTNDYLSTPDYLKGEPLPEIDRGLKVTTWNLHWFPGHTMSTAPEEVQKTHIRLAIEQIRHLDADILCLQEIKDPSALQRIVEAIPEYQIQMVSNFKRNLEIAILFKINNEAAFAQEFHPAEDTPPRGFVFAAFRKGSHMILIIRYTSSPTWEESRQALHSEKRALDRYTSMPRSNKSITGAMAWIILFWCAEISTPIPPAR